MRCLALTLFALLSVSACCPEETIGPEPRPDAGNTSGAGSGGTGGGSPLLPEPWAAATFNPALNLCLACQGVTFEVLGAGDVRATLDNIPPNKSVAIVSPAVLAPSSAPGNFVNVSVFGEGPGQWRISTYDQSGPVSYQFAFVALRLTN